MIYAPRDLPTAPRTPVFPCCSLGLFLDPPPVGPAPFQCRCDFEFRPFGHRIRRFSFWLFLGVSTRFDAYNRRSMESTCQARRCDLGPSLHWVFVSSTTNVRSNEGQGFAGFFLVCRILYGDLHFLFRRAPFSPHPVSDHLLWFLSFAGRNALSFGRACLLQDAPFFSVISKPSGVTI